MASNSADYIREWRKTPSGQAAMEDQKRREKAKRRALTKLAQAYPREFKMLLKAELKTLDLEVSVDA